MGRIAILCIKSLLKHANRASLLTVAISTKPCQSLLNMENVLVC
jgi:hypothetical protein